MAEFVTDSRTRERVAAANQRWRERHVPGLRRQARLAALEPSTLDKAWAAGFLDGEGYIGALRSGQSAYIGTRVAVSQVVVEPLLFLRDRWGGIVGEHGTYQLNRRDSFQWVLSNKTMVARFLVDVMPFLIVKRQQAGVLLELATLPKLVRGQQDDELVARRLALYAELRRLNRRGRSEEVV